MATRVELKALEIRDVRRLSQLETSFDVSAIVSITSEYGYTELGIDLQNRPSLDVARTRCC
jgi:hypothetical protein